jgi:signal transduction histidine kinase
MNSLSHNLKTPLNSVMTLASAGLELDEVEMKNDCLEDILKSGTVLLSMIKLI